jgi:hypothetical protein
MWKSFMRNDWRKSKVRIGSRRAIEHKKPMTPGGEHELCLAGRLGLIWPYNKTTYCAVITGCRVANALAESFGKQPDYKRGDEMLIQFGKERLEEVIKAIRVPVSQATQIRLADEFGQD